jgi:hypothetical protein
MLTIGIGIISYSLNTSFIFVLNKLSFFDCFEISKHSFFKGMKKVLELQFCLWGSYNFKTYPILFVLHSYFEHYIKKGVWSYNFMGWTIQKGQPKTKK